MRGTSLQPGVVLVSSVAEVASVQQPEWAMARRLYPLYWAMCSRFHLGGPCEAIERGEPSPQAIAQAKAWFAEMDRQIEPHQLRQVLQSTSFGTEEVLRDLITTVLDRQVKLGYDPAKIDFLLVQYFATVAPAEMFSRDVTLEEVSAVLEPVLGETATLVPQWLEPLETIINDLHGCQRLSELLARDAIQRARALKQAAGEMSHGSVALLAFTRFNFHARNTFFRVLQQEIREISIALDQLEKMGTTRIDGRLAGLSENESTSTLRQLVWEWKRPTRAAYSETSVLEQLAQIRAITDALLAPPPPTTPPQPVTIPEPKPEGAAYSAAEEPLAMASVPVPSSAAADALQSCLEQIAELLLANPKAMSSMFVELSGAKITVAAWEVAAFVRGGDEISDVLQRAVAARALLTCAKTQPDADFASLLAVARAEAEQVEACTALAKQTKNIDAAVNLAASGRRLLVAIAEIEKGAGQSGNSR
jgi:hypothetical protein